MTAVEEEAETAVLDEINGNIVRSNRWLIYFNKYPDTDTATGEKKRYFESQLQEWRNRLDNPNEDLRVAMKSAFRVLLSEYPPEMRDHWRVEHAKYVREMNEQHPENL